MTTFTTEDRINATGTCDCGRSPTGNCNGWHALSEDEYQKALAEWELEEYKRRAQELWNDSCTTRRSK